MHPQPIKGYKSHGILDDLKKRQSRGKTPARLKFNALLLEFDGMFTLFLDERVTIDERASLIESLTKNIIEASNLPGISASQKEEADSLTRQLLEDIRNMSTSYYDIPDNEEVQGSGKPNRQLKGYKINVRLQGSEFFDNVKDS